MAFFCLRLLKSQEQVRLAPPAYCEESKVKPTIRFPCNIVTRNTALDDFDEAIIPWERLCLFHGFNHEIHHFFNFLIHKNASLGSKSRNYICNPHCRFLFPLYFCFRCIKKEPQRCGPLISPEYRMRFQRSMVRLSCLRYYPQ